MNISLNARSNKRQKKGGASLAFGLNSRKKNTNVGSNVFGDDSDSSGNESNDDANPNISRKEVVNKQIAREQAALRRRAQAAFASAEDKNVYDYDGAYNSFRTEKDTAEQAKDQDPDKKSKYIGDLLKAAKVRERERDAIYERRNAREQAEEDAKDDYKGKEKFVTKSYKRKLQERKQWEAEQEQKEREEEANDVTKKSAGAAFSGFYGNLNRSAMMEQKTKNSEASADANVDQNEDDKRRRTEDMKPPDDDDFDPRQGFLGGFERSSHADANGTELQSNTGMTKEVKDEDSNEVAPLHTLSIRELRGKKVAEARERYLKRKQARQLEQ
jgi:coiled-coil domain-containing protein 55